ncbi:hypothetical protein JCM6882_006060 [Rhodosporidiobolus microsporus]
MLASESVLAFLDAPASAPPPSPSPHRLPRALLAAYSIDQDLKRAALDVLQRLTSKDRAARKRARLSNGSTASSDDSDEQPNNNGRRRVDLHVLLLPVESTSVETNDDVLEVLDEMGVHVHVHPVFPSSASRLSFTSPARSAISQALGPDGPYQPLLQDELTAAGFVFGSQPCEGNEACQIFVEILAKHAATAFPCPKASPTVTLYVPSRPATSDFDLDLPAEQVLSLRLVHSTAETFKSACPSSPPSPPRRSRLSWGGAAGGLAPSPPNGGHARRPSLSPSSSFLGAPSRTPSPAPLTSPASSAYKPLVLRPAPGPVQSVSLRLSLDTSTDVLFRVQETLTPVDQTTGGRFGPGSLLPPFGFGTGGPASAPATRTTTPLPRSPARPRIVESVSTSAAPKSPVSPSGGGSNLRRSRSIKRVDAPPAPVFDGSQHKPLTKQPIARSDTVLAPADLKRNPHLSELSNLLKGRTAVKA